MKQIIRFPNLSTCQFTANWDGNQLSRWDRISRSKSFLDKVEMSLGFL